MHVVDRCAATLAAALVLAACGGGEAAAPADPTAVLEQARASLDATTSVHFVLQSTAVPTSGTTLRGGEGDLARPDTFTGALDVSIDGFGATVEVRSTGGVFEAQLPFTEGFTETDPAELGFGDPANLLDPETGVSALLVSATTASVTGTERSGGDVLDVLEVELPGDLVADLLTSVDPARPVRGVVAVTQDDRELRRVELTGPFYDAAAPSTYLLLLTEHATAG